MARFTHSHYAGYECKYCKAKSFIASYHFWGFAVMKGQKYNHAEATAYAKANGYIDVEKKYTVKWDDEGQGF